MRDFNKKNIDKLQRDVRRLTAIPKGNTTTIINEGDTLVPDQTIMGKPVVANAIPKDGEALIYDERNKQWIPGIVSGMRGNAVFASATEPTDVEVGDIWIQI